jgi:hypothetical protein
MAEFYHFAQPNVAPAIPILNPVESKIKGFQAIAWRTPLSGIKVANNNVEATIYSFSTDYIPNASGMCAVQVQINWGGLDRTKGINAWDSTKYGNNQDKVKLSFGGMISLPFSTAPYLTDSSTGHKYPANYADFYLRGIDLKIGKSYWLQFFFYDNRGMPGDHFLGDVFTGEDTFVGTMKANTSKYMSLLPSSNVFTQQPFTDSRFIGGSISRKQFSTLMTDMKSLSNKQYSVNPDDHRIFAYGCTPELGRADTGACMKLTMYNLFLRTEY